MGMTLFPKMAFSLAPGPRERREEGGPTYNNNLLREQLATYG